MRKLDQNEFKRPFYLQTFFIIIMGSLWILYGIPLVIAIILLFMQNKHDKKHMSELKERVTCEVKEECKELIVNTEKEVVRLEQEAKIKIEKNKLSVENELKHIISKTQTLTISKNELTDVIESLELKLDKLVKQEVNLKKKIASLKPAHKAINSSIEYYRTTGEYSELSSELLEFLYPTVELPLHTQDVKVLKQKSNNVKKHIDKLLEQYEVRYTTKANKSIYSLMIIALQAELQNILYNLKFDKIDNTKSQIKEVAIKYIEIAGKGNKSIYGTLVKFIGELESLFLDLADIEYEYYVKKEQQKEEQRLIREQMAQEAAERKMLKEQQKKIEKEEQKYHQEISNLQLTLENESDSDKLNELENKIKELTQLLNEVEDKKEQIVNLQNGKAGNVYVISNLGSFGDNTFKVGMTRRLEPMDRIKELSSASVPFSFDVHSFIFSEDAPSLEKKMHDALNAHRVNKVNLRKEFFKVDIDVLEELVNDLDSTAEFKKTLVAMEYQQTLEIEKKNETA